tara:strand:- start:1429 stop:1575 length:147 start_codon:yes stop_codon:yes gene_type:complete
MKKKAFKKKKINFLLKKHHLALERNAPEEDVKLEAMCSLITPEIIYNQ